MMDLSKYDGIICVSGDGILVEVGFFFLMIANCMDFLFFFCVAQAFVEEIILVELLKQPLLFCFLL